MRRLRTVIPISVASACASRRASAAAFRSPAWSNADAWRNRTDPTIGRMPSRSIRVDQLRPGGRIVVARLHAPPLPPPAANWPATTASTRTRARVAQRQCRPPSRAWPAARSRIASSAARWSPRVHPLDDVGRCTRGLGREPRPDRHVVETVEHPDSGFEMIEPVRRVAGRLPSGSAGDARCAEEGPRRARRRSGTPSSMSLIRAIEIATPGGELGGHELAPRRRHPGNEERPSLRDGPVGVAPAAGEQVAHRETRADSTDSTIDPCRTRGFVSGHATRRRAPGRAGRRPGATRRSS